jgi:hypothetical protein
MTAAAALTAVPVRTTAVNEFHPTSEGAWFSWTQNSAARQYHYDVFAKKTGAGRVKVNAARTQAWGSGIDGQRLVYSQWTSSGPGSDPDLYLYNLTTGRRTRLPAKVNSAMAEDSPSLSGRWLLFTRHTVDDAEEVPVTRVFLYNLKTRRLRLLAAENGLRGYVDAGQVNGGYAVWARGRGNAVDVFRFHIPTGTRVRLPRPVMMQSAPSVTAAGTVYMTRSASRWGENARLVRFPVGGPATRLYGFPDGCAAGRTYADQRTDGSVVVTFDRYGSCPKGDPDIFKVVDPAVAP